jgi:peroxiredoxin (alkyl hydroperoxide reductase subunit C)
MGGFLLEIGQKIPEMGFDVFHEGEIKRARLSDYTGKWLVLLFYPADFTFVCPTELGEAARHYGAFREAGAELVSVSTDTAFVHMAWHQSNPMVKGVSYPMAADPGGKLCRAFGTYMEDAGLSTRATFIIDPEGIVKAVEMHDNSIGRSAAEILRKLQAAKFVRENAGHLCPASWRPGGETIRLPGE